MASVLSIVVVIKNKVTVGVYDLEMEMYKILFVYFITSFIIL